VALEPRVSAVVPTLGASPWLPAALEALRREGVGDLEILLVRPAALALTLPAGLVDREVVVARNRGFAAATNRGLEVARGRFVAMVNDDLVVEPGWLAALVAVLEDQPRVAAVQGVNLEMADPTRVDGWGLAWNARWEAVQLGRGQAPLELDAVPFEVFGASATAALYRRSALAEVALPGGQMLEERLGSYYEDVELAGRLRAKGWSAWAVPAARARHAGSVTGRRLGLRSAAWLFGNRHLAAARFLGSSFWRAVPTLVGGDLRHLGGALRRGELRRALGVVLGWGRVGLGLPSFLGRSEL
jgi:GT2 family glycosyltransferase